MPFDMNELKYQNPVYDGYFADPFVLRTRGKYFAYGTGPTNNPGRAIPVLSSPDLIHWTSHGGALELLTQPPANNYWAPEVAEKNGKYLLYYSASTSDSDADQRLRVAMGDRPEGPFRDSGKMLLPEMGFTIDADPFIDPRDGKAYLFFCMDYERDEPTGTGICVVQLNDQMTAATSEPRMVVRASADWQIYERNRDYKGRVWPKWNCVEGPSVIYHEGKYYCFYSGGAWHGKDYGVEVAIADHPLGQWNDERALTGPSVLKAIPGKVIGPGHNSVVRGPDGKSWVMVYHAWNADHTLRRMCIDPIIWTDQGPKVDGPSTEFRSLQT